MCNFQPIDIQTRPMAQAFHYYTQMAPTSYTVNVNMEVSLLRKELKTKGIKFFPSYLYLVTKAITEQQELRVAVKGGILGYWDCSTPAYPQFHEDSHAIIRYRSSCHNRIAEVYRFSTHLILDMLKAACLNYFTDISQFVKMMRRILA